MIAERLWFSGLPSDDSIPVHFRHFACGSIGPEPPAEASVVIDLMRDPAEKFPELASTDVRALRVWHCKYKTLAPIGRLRNLEVLVIASCPDASLDWVCGLSELEYLQVLHLPRVTDLAPLATLTRLRTLRLSTIPSWDASGKKSVIDSLRPLASLSRLRHLELFGVVPASDDDLMLLASCPSLASVRLSKYPAAAVAKFYAAMRVTDDFAPAPDVDGW